MARNGDTLGCPFQCDFCCFVNVRQRVPDETSYNDARLLCYIRRVNLDMFWSREPPTVAALLTQIKKGNRMSRYLGLDPVALPLGPWPARDDLGFQIAIEILRASQEPGRNVASYQQYDSIRKIRSAYSSIFESSPLAAKIGLSFKGSRGAMVHFTDSPLNSLFFRSFMSGLEKRMGKVVCQDLGLDVRILKSILENMDAEIRDPATPWARKRHLAVCAGAFVSLYAGALRGGEVFLMEGKELASRINQGRMDTRGSHVYVPLMGRFKHENGERNLMFAFVSVTDNSQLPVRQCLERLVFILRKEGRDNTVGPALCDANGFVYSYWKMNSEFHDQLQQVNNDSPHLFDSNVVISERYNIFRSFRRGATTRAREMKVEPSIISMNNRWRKSQNQSGSVPNLPMMDLYTEIQQALLTRLSFSKSL